MEAKSATTNSDEVPQGTEDARVVKDRTRANQNKVTQSMEPGSIKADRNIDDIQDETQSSKQGEDTQARKG